MISIIIVILNNMTTRRSQQCRETWKKRHWSSSNPVLTTIQPADLNPGGFTMNIIPILIFIMAMVA